MELDMHITSHSFITKYTSNHPSDQVLLWILCTIMLSLTGCQLIKPGTITDEGYTDIFMKNLKEQGFEPNIGFTPLYEPGTIVQVISLGADGKPYKEVMPRVFLSSEECFPNVKTKTIDAVLPGVTGTQNSGFQLHSKLVEIFLPNLDIDNTQVENYSMKINKPKVLLMPKGDMLGNMSKKCRKALHFTLKGGDKIEWYRVIDEVMAADGFSFRLSWAATSGFDIGYRDMLHKQLKDHLSSATDSKPSSASISATDESERFSELKTDKQVFFAYKYRSLYVIDPKP